MDGPDWKANVANEVNRLTAQHDQAIRIAEILVSQGINIRFTGHSLGGGLASLAAATTGRNATTFNSSGVSDRILATYRLSRTDVSGIAAISHRSDILGNLQRIPNLHLERPLGMSVMTGTVFNYGSIRFHAIDHMINSIRKNIR